jgi:GAF domain-containing protein
VEASALIAAAELCTAFQQARDADELRALVGRAADLMDAAGLIVWVGDATGAVLTPALAHGYSDQVLVRLGDVPRMADNAAAAAYRSGSIQVVTGRPGLTLGAIVVPLVSPAGCIGALAAEIRHEGETSHRVRALAALFSAQLATIVSPRPPAASAQARAVSA